ncbi:hypothetical protein NBRC10512v2_000223 [Rhodotorula toruloides]
MDPTEPARPPPAFGPSSHAQDGHERFEEGAGRDERWDARWEAVREQQASGAASAPSDQASHGGNSVRPSLASPVSSPDRDPDALLSPHDSSHLSPTTTSPPSSSSHPRRPPSALSSTSASSHSHPYTSLSSPRSQPPQPPSYASSSFTSATAFDYDELLGPRPAQRAGEEGERRESRLTGLGFVTSPKMRERDVAGGVEGGVEAGEEERDRERWAQLRSLRLESPATDPTPSSFSPPSATPLSFSSQRTSSSTTTTTAQVSASPLSPLVAPFAPSGALGGRVTQVAGAASPWATSSAAMTGGGRDAAARVREASWNSTASGFASSASSHRHLATLSSTSSFPGSPASHLSPTAYPAHPSSGFSSPLPPPHHSDSPSYPPSSHPMSESGSRDSRTLGLVDKGGYLRSAPPPGTTPLGAFLAQAGLAAAQQSAQQNGSGSASGTESLGAGESSEAVTTIFVVGFPDDTTEREFQNMFAFAEGFEAATLKVPAPLSALELAAQEHKEREEEAMGLLAPVPPMPGLPPHLQSSLSSVSSAREGAGTPSSTNGQAGQGQLQQRRQIIGFAKFRTRRQAAEAVDILSGRKIDPERPSVLKAEMAKKNLHTRKSVPSSVVLEQGPPSRLGMGTPTASLQQQQQPTPPTAVEAAAPVAAAATSAASAISGSGGGGPSIPLSALDAGTLARLANAGNLNPAVLAEIARQKLLAAGGGGHGRTDSAYDAFHSVPAPPTTGLGSTRPPLRELYDDPTSSPQTGYPPGPSSSTSSASPPHVYAAPSALAAAALGGKSMLQQLDEGLIDDPLRGGGGGGGQSVYGGCGLHTRESSYTSYAPYVPANGRPQEVPQTARQAALQNPLASPPLGYPSSLGSIPRTQNPADMNAPKNTLYVGGLPAVLPSLTGPFSASHLEDSLRNAFSRCPGFKRLQFRNKSNGPIVFVEFVDTAHATRAMQELYGHTLGGLVKGGIRLSYSKNPLGVRSNGLPSGNPPPLQPPMQNPLDLPPSSSYGGAPPYPASSAVVGPYDSAPYDPHRRPPDPIYGDSPYATALGSIARSPAMPHLSPLGGPAPSLGGGPSYAAAPLPPAAAPSTHYGGSFSPFGFDG